MTDTTENKPKFETINLSTPVQRGETKIDSFTLRKPHAGELRGLNMAELINLDVTTLLKLIPRISNPPLLQHEADALEADDLTECTGAIRGFFMTKAERAMMETVLAAHLPSS